MSDKVPGFVDAASLDHTMSSFISVCLRAFQIIKDSEWILHSFLSHLFSRLNILGSLLLLILCQALSLVLSIQRWKIFRPCPQGAYT